MDMELDIMTARSNTATPGPSEDDMPSKLFQLATQPRMQCMPSAGAVEDFDVPTLTLYHPGSATVPFYKLFVLALGDVCAPDVRCTSTSE